MNNYVNTEKSLKRWLKNRIKVTMATVVGFLIAGITAFGSMIVYDGNTQNPDISNGLTQSIFESAKGGLTTGTNKTSLIRISTNGTENNELEISGNFTGTGKDNYLITSNTTSKAKITIKEGSVLTYNNVILNLQGTGEYINKGTLKVTGTNIYGAVIINGKTGTMSFTNEGKIDTSEAILKTAVDLTSDAKQNAIVFNNSGTIIGDIKESGTGSVDINLTKGSHIEGKISMSSSGTDNLNIIGVTGENGAEELQSVTGAEKITIKDGSNVKISAGSMKASFVNTQHNLIEIENSILENGMNISDNGKEFQKGSSLISVYGKDGKNAKLINHGELTVTNGSQAIYANASGKSTVEIENDGVLTNKNNSNWSSVINGKIDGNDSKISIVNNGTINTNTYGTGIDVTIKDGVTGAIGEIINNGNIIASEEAKYATGIQVEGNSADIKVTNSGTGKIEVGTGVGIFLNNDKAFAENKGTIIVNDEQGKAITGIEGSTAENSGVIKAGYDTTDMTDEEILENLLGENTTNSGIVLDENGEIVAAAGNEWIGELTTTALNEMGETIKITEGTTGTLTGNMDDPAKDKQFNLAGGVMEVTGDSAIENSNFAVTGKGMINVTEGVLDLTDVTINGTEAETALNVEKALKLNGNNEIAGNVAGTGNIDIVSGKTVFDGEFGASSLNIGVVKSQAEGYFTADSKFTSATTVDSTNGVLTIAVADDQSNALANSTADVTVKGNVGFDYSSLTKDTTLALGNENVNHNLADAEALNDKDSVYKVTIDDESDTAKFEYNKELLADYGDKLNSINNGFQVIQNKVSEIAGTTEERAALADRIYAGNVYAETMKTAYDNSKLVEDTILSLETENKVGKWTTIGKALYSKNEYDREGVLGEYKSDVESTGLMAAFEYGVNETTSVGFAFAGVKQDLDTEMGSADGDAFYFGAFADKKAGNNKFTAGLGYQLDKFDADNEIFGGGDEYDSNTFSAYVQAKHIIELEDGVTFEPKLKVGYTYVDQDSVKDDVFEMKSQDMSVFDTEAGFDVVKSVQLEKTKVNVRFGASYIKTMGDTDEEFTGNFHNEGIKGTEFNVMGAELAENTVKFNLGAEAVNENGFFYNGGFTYEFGSNDTEAYRVNVGVGYKF